MSIKVGSIGVPLRVATGFDMSGYTSLTLKLTKPDGSTLTKTSASDGVDAPAVALTGDPYLGDVNASTYFEYVNTVDDYDQDGTWTVCGTYVDATQTLPVKAVPFTVEEGCS